MLPSAVVQLLPTPRTANNENRQSEDRYGPNLGMALGTTPGYEHRLLPTPLVGSTSPASHGQISGQWRDAMSDALSRWGEYAAAIARHEQAWGVPAPEPTEPGPKGNPRLSAAFCEWMMMQPAGWITDVPGVTRNEALKILGNGVVTPQCVAALRVMVNRTTAPALDLAHQLRAAIPERQETDDER